MKQVSREEAVAHIADLLDEAAHGQDVLVTDRGKPSRAAECGHELRARCSH